jgi:hypothetical protein
MKKSHIWLMILCCLIPVVGLVAVYFFQIPFSKAVFFGLMLVCPLSHLVMMKFMGHDHSPAEQDSAHQHEPNSVITSSQER